MRIIVEDSIFASQADMDLHIISLFALAVDGRHLIQIDPLDAASFNTWVRGHKLGVQELIKFALEIGLEIDALEASRVTVRVAAIDRPDWTGGEPRLPLLAALDVATMPLRIALENGINDRNFLMAVSGPYRDELEKLEAKRWITFENGGGITVMSTWVDQNTLKREHRFRTWVIFDSDALRPGCPSEQSNNLKKVCNRRVPRSHHQLKRRAIENYIPTEAVSLWEQRAQRVDDKTRRRKLLKAFVQLSPIQRHHYNMKSGFAGDAKRQDIAKVKDLYDEVDQSIRTALHEGFGNHISECFSREIHEHWLRRDGQTEEIYPVIKRILALA